MMVAVMPSVKGQKLEGFMRFLFALLAAALQLTACDSARYFQGDRMSLGQDRELGRLNTQLAGDRAAP